MNHTTMKFFLQYNLFVSVVFLSFFLKTTHSYPCPLECLCKPVDMTDDDFTRMNYIMDCRNVTSNDNRFIYRAQSWSIVEDRRTDDEDDDNINNDYIISIDLSDSSSLKQFNNKTIELTGFSFLLQSLSLTSQTKHFQIDSNTFNANIYQNLKVLNLSSCCQQTPIDCPQLFRPLSQLQVLDLSASDMYKSCLNTPGTISSTLNDLILRSNYYDTNTFSHSSFLFDAVLNIDGKLDLQYSRFKTNTQSDGNCLFDKFNSITTLDLSNVRFDSVSNDIEKHLTHLLKCKRSIDNIRHGEQLLNLYLRQLNLQYLPEWLNDSYFPRLTQLDLSYNNIYTIDFRTFSTLTSISLAYNPIELDKVMFRSDHIYEFINLCSTIRDRTFNLQKQLDRLFKLTTNIDFSKNNGIQINNITMLSIDIDFSKEISLNLSQTNIYSLNIQDISKLENLNRLDISSNCLTELNLQNQAKLSYLDCSNQNIKSLKLNKDYSNLIELKCSNNLLTTIENFSFLKHKNLRLIDLSFNLIESLENLFSNFNSLYLKQVNLKSNLIKQISTNTFNKYLISLHSIDLSSNRIDTIRKYAFQAPNLQILDLTNNPLKNVEANFLLTSSLRMFYIINGTQDLVDRCKQASANDNLLLTYLNWFEQNATYMKKTQVERSRQINFDQCLRRYTSRSKTKWMKLDGKYHVKYLSLYIIMGATVIGAILGIIYLYKENKINVLTHLQRYRPLDGQCLVENTDDISRHEHEDDEIVMSLSEVPFNNNNKRI